VASKAEITNFMAEAFPHSQTEIVDVADRSATIRRPVIQSDLRPGGTVSGPTIMALADSALYVAIHATLGITPHAVTSSLNVHFLRRPAGDKPVIAICKLLRVGRTQVVGEVSLFSEGNDEPVAHVVGTYALPTSARASSSQTSTFSSEA
jgi:uncharacterized protein (TIGR00369 family)